MFENLNQRIKRLTVIDIGMTKWSVFFATVIIVKLFPQLLGTNYPILIILMLVMAAKPLYVVWFKK